MSSPPAGKLFLGRRQEGDRGTTGERCGGLFEKSPPAPPKTFLKGEYINFGKVPASFHRCYRKLMGPLPQTLHRSEIARFYCFACKTGDRSTERRSSSRRNGRKFPLAFLFVIFFSPLSPADAGAPPKGEPVKSESRTASRSLRGVSLFVSPSHPLTRELPPRGACEKREPTWGFPFFRLFIPVPPLPARLARK